MLLRWKGRLLVVTGHSPKQPESHGGIADMKEAGIRLHGTNGTVSSTRDRIYVSHFTVLRRTLNVTTKGAGLGCPRVALKVLGDGRGDRISICMYVCTVCTYSIDPPAVLDAERRDVPSQ